MVVCLLLERAKLSPLLQRLEKWNLNGVAVEDNSPETGVAMPTMWVGLLATVVIVTTWVSLLSFPSFPMGCFLLEIVAAIVGMICNLAVNVPVSYCLWLTPLSRRAVVAP